ncbi:MAG: RNA polymerase factor sigma-54 [Pseudomonadota bacterium]
MKHSLNLRLSQHLTLTPQLQQSIRLLQLSTLELNQELERFLQENPLLERVEGSSEAFSINTHDPSLDHAVEADGTPTPNAAEAATDDAYGSVQEISYGSPAHEDGDDDDYQQQAAAETPTLREHLIGQLSLIHLSERDRTLVSLLIESLDDDGYLTQELAEIQSMLPAELDIEIEELQIALQHLHHLEPTGVGARDLRQCLNLQLAACPPQTPYLAQALEVVSNHLDVLAARDFNQLRKILQCDDTCLRGVQKLITALNPRPGRAFAVEDTRYVIPDVIVRKVKGVWLAALNEEAMPKLRLNQLYTDILSRARDAGSHQLTAQLNEARWLIKNIQQRFDTILRVSQAIVDRQRHFYEHGEVAMRPLVLREIADALSLHESTVSRVTTQKYMHTPRGVYELKYFFGSHVNTESGGAASSTAIRALIRQLVSAENTCKPLSDSQLAEILGQQGIVVARRTVAKYRESMQILPVNLRKTI